MDRGRLRRLPAVDRRHIKLAPGSWAGHVPVIKPCAMCGDLFGSAGPGHLRDDYCTAACRDARYIMAMGLDGLVDPAGPAVRPCQGCGGPMLFHPRVRLRFCSNGCKRPALGRAMGLARHKGRGVP